MHLQSKYTLVLLALTSSLIMTSSCVKEQPPCHGNCVVTDVVGRVYNKTNGTGIKNAPISLNWFYRPPSIATVYRVFTGETDSTGNFHFKVKIDTSFFSRGYQLVTRLLIPQDSIYFIFPLDGAAYPSYTISDYSPDALKNLEFECYPKVTLHLKIHQRPVDSLKTFFVTHSFVQPVTFWSVYWKRTANNPSFPMDTIIDVQTSENIYTKLHWEETFTNGNSLTFTDSLICSPDSSNTYEINL